MSTQLELALPGARHVPCRVCGGACEVPHFSGLWKEPCAFCVNGVARFTCADCGEALPLCSCFGELRAPARVTA